MDNDALTGLWLGATIQTRTAKTEAAMWEGVSERLGENMQQVNAKLIDVAATRDAYKALNTELILELKNQKPRRLSAPEADKERIEHLEQTKRMSLEKYNARHQAEIAERLSKTKSRR